MGLMLRSIPELCAPLPEFEERKAIDPETQRKLDDFASIGPYPDTVWGGPTWTRLESSFLSFPEQIDENEFRLIKAWLMLDARYLPCGDCAKHFEHAIRTMPNNKEIRTRAGMLKWLTDVKNDVNRRKGVPTKTHREIIDTLRAKSHGGQPSKKKSHRP